MRRELEVMRVLRVPPLGKLEVEVNGERFQNLLEIADEKARRVLLAAIGELIGFAGNYEALVEAGVAPPLAGSGQTAPSEPPIEQRQAEFLTRLEGERDAVENAQPSKPQFSVPGGAKPRSDAPQPAPVKRELSVAEQIDMILQKLVASDPEMVDRSIHLVQDPMGGIRIKVDGKMYQKPGDIPEPPVQLLIKRAVKEWDAA